MLTRAVAATAAIVCLAACLFSAAAIGPAAPASADAVRNTEMWVLNELNVQPAWSHTQGKGVIVAVIDSGVNPDVSDLTGSVLTGPDLTGVQTPPTNPAWGVHGTWMASLIAGHGHADGSGIIGVAPQSTVLSIRVITDPSDPGYRNYEHQPAARGQAELATAIRYAVRHKARVISMSLGYTLASRAVRAALQYAYNRNVVVVASAGNSGTTAGAQGDGHAPYSFPANYPGVLAVGAVNGPARSPAFRARTSPSRSLHRATASRRRAGTASTGTSVARARRAR